ncbi:hypothetical protein D3C71_1270760 [compost metagenome]
MQRPHAAEIEIGRDVEIGKGELQRHHDTHQKTDDTPEHGGDDAVFHHLIEIFRLEARTRRLIDRRKGDTAQQKHRADQKCKEQHPHMGSEKTVMGKGCPEQREKGPEGHDRGF